MRAAILVLSAFLSTISATTNPFQDSLYAIVRTALGAERSPALARSAASAGATITRPEYSLYFTEPAGWSAATPVVTANGALSISLTSQSLSGMAEIFAWRFDNEDLAYGNGFFRTFRSIGFANSLSDYMSGIYDIGDTVVNGIAYCNVQTKTQTVAGTYDYIMVTFTQSAGIYSHEATFYTTVGDWNTNSDSYMACWNNLLLTTGVSSVAGAVSAPVQTGLALVGAAAVHIPSAEGTVKLDLYDSKGRHQGCVYEGPAGVTVPVATTDRAEGLWLLKASGAMNGVIKVQSGH